MKIFRLLFVCLILAALVVPVISVVPVGATGTRFEYYITGDDGFGQILSVDLVDDQYWAAQTFTPAISHTITNVNLLLYRANSPGTITVSIKATAAGVPSGADLISGTTDGNTLTTNTAGEWRTISLGSGISLTSGTQYAIVVREAGGTIQDIVRWRSDNSSPGYAGGSYVTSADSGSTWTANTSRDFMFEEWSPAIVPSVATLAASSITFKGATLNSSVTSDGGDTTCQIRYGYGTTTQTAANFESYDVKTAWVDGYNTSDPAPLNITSLSLQTTYYYRAQVKNSVGTVTSTNEVFFTSATYTQLQSWDIAALDYDLPIPDQPPEMYDESGPQFPGGTLPDEVSDAGEVPRSVFWTIIPTLILCLIGIGIFQVTGSLVVQAGVLITLMIVVMALLLHVWPLYLAIPTTIEAAAITLSSKIYGY